jgi:hypothetical protein
MHWDGPAAVHDDRRAGTRTDDVTAATAVRATAAHRNNIYAKL